MKKDNPQQFETETFEERWARYRKPEGFDQIIPLHGILRSHHDGLDDYVSFMTGTVNLEPSETRTEFADEADINKILDRYTGPQSLQARPVKYGETIDYTIDLQTALHAVGEAEAAYIDHVPPELRNNFPTWREWLNATASGQYQAALADLAEKKAKAEPKKPEETPVTEEPPKDPPSKGKKGDS